MIYYILASPEPFSMSLFELFGIVIMDPCEVLEIRKAFSFPLFFLFL